MEKHYVGSEIGQLRSVMLHRPNLSLKRLTPSNCQELLFDDVLSVERAGEEHDIFLRKRLILPKQKPGFLKHKSPTTASAQPLPATSAAGWRICRTGNWRAD